MKCHYLAVGKEGCWGVLLKEALAVGFDDLSCVAFTDATGASLLIWSETITGDLGVGVWFGGVWEGGGKFV